jgi:hypothetical protein
MMEWKHDCFGKDLPPDDVLTVLQVPPRASDLFRELLKASLEAIIMVIENGHAVCCTHQSSECHRRFYFM